MDHALKPFPGFVSLATHHCVTGSMRHIYAFNGHDLSEDLLLGLGEGVGFMYWRSRGQPPFLGGRAAQKTMEKVAGKRTGVVVEDFSTASPHKARQALLDMLAAGQPAMLQVDMGFLPYFNFGGQEYHFGGHVIVACGYNFQTQQVLIAERDGLYPVPLAHLEEARASSYKPFPPKNHWWTFDFTGFRSPAPAEVRQAIAAQAAGMLVPPTHNFGIKGIHLAAESIPHWGDQMTLEELRMALFNTYIFISPVGGSGGGLFRYMFSRFLCEAGAITGDQRLVNSAEAFQRCGDAWESFATWAKGLSEADDPAARLGEANPLLLALADQEQAAWEELPTGNP